jgi:galactokinase
MDIRKKFKAYFGYFPLKIARAPGRVNLLGEHVDYNEGIVLPVAIDRWVQFAATPTDDGTLHLVAADLGKQIRFHLHESAHKIDTDGATLPGWALYPAGVVWSLQAAGFKLPGMQVVYNSNIPIGSGLSSSAAVEVGFAVLSQEFGGWKLPALELAQLCQRAENMYVGVSCGLMDQFASACGVEGHALYLDTRSLEWGTVPLPAGTALVIADSGVRRSLASSAYNERRTACEQAVELLRAYLPGIKALRDVSTTEFAAFGYYLPGEIRKRAEHVVKEIARVESALSALQRNDRQAFGALMYAGHRSLRDLYEVSTPELDLLVDLARNLPGCIGARLTGAGFGGCTINLVESKYAQEFIKGLKTGYARATNRNAQIYLCKAHQGAGILNISEALDG